MVEFGEEVIVDDGMNETRQQQKANGSKSTLIDNYQSQSAMAMYGSTVGWVLRLDRQLGSEFR